MASASMPQIDGEKALEQLRSADPPLFLSPSPDLSGSARAASRYLFSSLLPHCPKPPIECLLTEDDFDAEQIWSQIDLLSRPILSLIRRELNRLDRVEPVVSAAEEEAEEEAEEMEEEAEEMEEEAGDDGEEEEEDEEEEEEEEEEKGEMNGVEDKFLKIRELEDYLEDDEAREFGFEKKGGRGERKEVEDDMDDDEGDEGEDDEGDEEDEEVKKTHCSTCFTCLKSIT